eukprot:CAMPEP_0119272594 /NCGR_PEP_ID=MMETSP1329-20130426/8782_1 /TAXON_ID=114041 /ORGANISM="Genus nov. species nov., Strain RCC1024" /LENGTH=136 /DNA_ID=CAMNT_0007272669 /DNA_START=29 /DNA_END=442 /DNA_ORIENTATION=-
MSGIDVTSVLADVVQLEVEVDVGDVVHGPLGQREPDELAHVGVLVAHGALVLGRRHKDRVFLGALVRRRHDGVPRVELALARGLEVHLGLAAAGLLLHIGRDFAIDRERAPRVERRRPSRGPGRGPRRERAAGEHP